MVSEVGLNEPPPPAIVMLALAMGLQPGDGLGLGEGLGLALGDGLGLGDGLALGEGLGLGLGPCASVTVAPALKKIALMATTTHWIQSFCFPGRGRAELRDGVVKS